jgi:hypothetical protein
VQRVMLFDIPNKLRLFEEKLRFFADTGDYDEKSF